jgi:hypothetical protein
MYVCTGKIYIGIAIIHSFEHLLGVLEHIPPNKGDVSVVISSLSYYFWQFC